MKWSLVVAAILTVARVAEAAEPGQLPVIHLEIDNDAGVAPEILRKSQHEVERIFARARFAVEWTETGPRLTVQVVKGASVDPFAASTVMGAASRTRSAATAQIFFDQVQELARTYRVDLSRVLAGVVAHEIGHLLLPSMPHSMTGLMKADWDSDLLREAAEGSLTFTAGQIERLHAAR